MAVIKLIAAVLIVAFTLGLGVSQRPAEFARALRSWKVLARGLALNLILVPLIALFVVRTLALSWLPGAALIVLAVCPGAPFSPRSTRVMRGNVPQAEVLTLMLGALTALTAAPSARLLLSYAGPADLHPLQVIARLLVLQWVPLSIGLAIQHFSPKWAAKIGKVAGVVLWGALALLLVVLVGPRLGSMGLLGGRGAFAALVILGFGLALAALLGRSQRASGTLVSISAMPNVGLAVLLVTSARARPEATLVIIGAFLLRAVGYGAVLAAVGLRSRRRERLPPAGALPA